MLDPHLCWLCPHLMCFLTTFSMSDIVWRWLPQVLANCADKGTAAGRLSPGKMGIFYPQNGYFHRQNDEKAPNVVADFQTNPPVSVLWRNTDKWICEQWSWSDPPTMNNGLLLVSPLQNLQAQHWFFLSIPTQRDFGCEPLGGLPQKPPRQRQLLGFFWVPPKCQGSRPRSFVWHTALPLFHSKHILIHGSCGRDGLTGLTCALRVVGATGQAVRRTLEV